MLAVLHQVHTQVFALGTHQTGVVAADSVGDEDRRGVSRSEGLKFVQLATEIGRDLAELQLGIDLDLRNQHLGLDMLLDVGIESTCELLDIFGFHCQSCGVHMTSEVLQQIGTRFNRLIEVEARHTTRRTRSKTVAHRHHNRRAIVRFDQARGHDTNDTLHPLGVVDDRTLAILQLGIRLDQLVRLDGYRAVNALSVLIERIDHRAKVLGHLLVALNEQIHSRVATRRSCIFVLFIDAHTTCGIDTRTDLEDDVVDCDSVLFEPTDLDDRQQSLAGTLIETSQTIVSQNAVLARQRHDVRGDTHYDQIEQSLDLRERNVVAQGVGLHQFETDTTTRQLLERILAIVAFGIEHSDRLGQMICG